MIDLTQLRATIAATPESGTAATVTRRFLEQVEREISDGRAAIARLQMQLGTSQLCDAIRAGARP